MKNVILFLMLAIGFIVSAQTVTLPFMAIPNANATSQVVTTDYTLSATTVRNFIWTAPQNFPTTQDFVINLDSLTGNHTNVAVALYGQKSQYKGDWTQIGSTVNWKGTTSDTTILISNATANRYSLYKTEITGTGAASTTKIDIMGLKLYLE